MLNAITAIFTSASKIVFILLSVSACVGFFIGILESKDFMVLASMAFGFYFAAKPSDPTAGGARK